METGKKNENIKNLGVIITNCPSCGYRSLNVSFLEYEAGLAGSILINTLICETCGYKDSSIFSLKEGKTKRKKIIVKGIEDLKTKVFRSETTTIKIPELGVEITPGSKANSYITNIEGILNRVEDALQKLVTLDEGKRKEVEEKLNEIKKIKNGDKEISVIIEDPEGKSFFIPTWKN